jgi:hypothetical protein
MPDNDKLLAELEDAAIEGMTLVLFHGYLDLAASTGAERNRFYVDRYLATPAVRFIGPNVETIYGFGWIDLNNGPQVLEVPDTADRYYCLQFMDACLQTIDYIGRRTTGTAAGTFLLTGPGWSGEVPAGMTPRACPTNLMFLLPRMQVRDAQDPADALESRELLEALSLGALSDYPEGRRETIAEDEATGPRFPALDLAGMGAAYFDRLCEILVTQPLPADEQERFARFAALGIAAGRKPTDDPAIAPLLEAALDNALRRARGASPMVMLGDGPWATSAAISDVGSVEPLTRAAMNLGAPGYHPAVECIYAALMKAADGSRLSGDESYRIHFPPRGVPPVRAFWSITMYAMPEMKLVENSINRYAIGSNFEDLVYGEDGSLEIMLQRDVPLQDASNWLPTPEGRFMLMCRFYEPGQELIGGTYSLPPAVAVQGE